MSSLKSHQNNMLYLNLIKFISLILILCTNIFIPSQVLSQEILLRQLMNTRPNYFYNSGQTTTSTTSNPLYNSRRNGENRELIKLVRRQKNQFEFPPTIAKNQYASPLSSSLSISAGRSLSESSSSGPWTVAKRGLVGLFKQLPKMSTTTTTTTKSPQYQTTVASQLLRLGLISKKSNVTQPFVSSPQLSQKQQRPSKTISFPKRNFIPKFPNHVRYYSTAAITTSTSATTTTAPTTATEEPITTTTTTTEKPVLSSTKKSSSEIIESEESTQSQTENDNENASNSHQPRTTNVIRKTFRRPIYRRRRPNANGSRSTESKSIESTEAERTNENISSRGSITISNVASSSPVSNSSMSIPSPLVSSEEVTEVQISPDSTSNTEYIVITNGGGVGLAPNVRPHRSHYGHYDTSRSIIHPGTSKVTFRSQRYHDYNQHHHHNQLDQHQHHPSQEIHYHHPPSKKVQHGSETSLMPLDKTLVYVGMITSWMFWIVVFTWYYFWNNKALLDSNANNKENNHNHYGTSKMDSVQQDELTRRVILNLNELRGIPHVQQQDNQQQLIFQQQQDQQQQLQLQHPQMQQQQQQFHHQQLQPQQYQNQQTHFVQKRSIDSTPSTWNLSWGQVLYMLSLAQETYEKFDFQSLECQKKALCELSQRQNDFGETGRKISNTFSFLDVVEGLPMPTIIQTYLKEYREALNQGKNSSKDCAMVYSKCNFSVKELIAKYQKRAAAGKF